jgi:hypothetical protein
MVLGMKFMSLNYNIWDYFQIKRIFDIVKFLTDCFLFAFLNRKNDLRELKMLQKQENKQHQDLTYKSHCAREDQERKFEMDMQVTRVIRTFNALSAL